MVLQPLLSMAGRETIVDVGAATSIGASSNLDLRPSYSALLRALPCRLIGFDPNDEGEAGFLALSRFDNIEAEYVRELVGDGSPHAFHVTSMRSRSSIYPPNPDVAQRFNAFWEGSEVERIETRPTVMLDVLLEHREVHEVDYLKIDVQGGTLPVLHGADSVLSMFPIAEIEVEFVEQYTGQPLFGDIDAYMRARGYLFHRFLGYGSRTLRPVVYQNDPLGPGSQWLWANAVYIPAFHHLGGFTASKLARAALIYHEVFEAYDFAYHHIRLIDHAEGTALCDAYSAYLASGAP